MANKSRRRHSAKSSTTSTIQKSLRDAQAVFARYFESGGKRVKETFDALTEIFEKRHLNSALRVSPAPASASARSASRRRASAARAKSSPRRTGGTAKSMSTPRGPKRGTRAQRKSS